MQMPFVESLIKHSDTEWSYGKYQIYLEYPTKYEVYYKDHGIQYTSYTLEDCIEEIIAMETFDYGDPE